jgi:hypothetical protein
MQIGDRVEEGAVVATVDGTALRAPISGIIRGLTRDGVDVAIRAKVIEIDPRGDSAAAFGLGERPRRITIALGCALLIGGIRGLIGLGGGEFRLPLLVGLIGFTARGAVPMNQILSLITLITALIVRWHTGSLIGSAHLPRL